jgi:uncharacterized membrane protein
VGFVVLIILIFFGAVVSAVIRAASFPGKINEQRKQLAELRGRVDKLEGEIQNLKSPRAPESPGPVKAAFGAAGVSGPAEFAANAAAPGPAPSPSGAVFRAGPAGSAEPDANAAAPGPAPSPAVPAADVRGRAGSALWRPLVNFVKSGNFWVSGGVALIFIALALFFTYMARRGYITVELRIAGAALLGLAMTVSGWVFRNKRRSYFLVLQGGGIGVLYLCVYAASRLIPYITPPLALLVMSFLIPPAIALALLQRSQPLAVFGFLGGFAAPLLLSSGSGSHIFLFTYYAFLDLAVFVIVYITLWRGLICLAFFSTFITALVWVFGSYEAGMFWSVEPFIFFYFALFTLTGIGTGGRKGFSLKQYLDIPAAAGTPPAVLLIHWRILADLNHGYAWSCVIFGALYLVLAAAVWKKRGRGMGLLARSYLAAAVFLVNLAIPLELTPGLTMALWAAEGALLYYLGGRLGDWRVKLGGLIVYAASVFAFFSEDHSRSPGTAFLRNTAFTGALIIALSALVMALSVREGSGGKDRKTPEEAPVPAGEGGKAGTLSFFRNLSPLFIAWGLLWWFCAWGLEFYRNLEEAAAAYFIFISANALLFFAGARLFRAPFLKLALILPPAFAFLYVPALLFSRPRFLPMYEGVTALWNHNFFRGLSGWAWLVFILSQGLLIYLSRRETRAAVHGSWMLINLLVLTAVLSATGRALAAGLSASWTSLAGILPLFVFSGTVLALGGKKFFSSLAHRRLLLFVFPLILVSAAGLWFLVTLFFRGDPAPLPLYIPLINPLELKQAFCVMLLVFWHARSRSFAGIPGPSTGLTAVLADIMVFLWLNAMLWRSVHFIGGVPWRGAGETDLYRFCLFVLWGMYGIGHIITGNKTASRPVWIAGSILALIDVFKLLVVDLAEAGTLPRIASFFIAGLFFLFIGWAAPLPPASTAKEPRDETNPRT